MNINQKIKHFRENKNMSKSELARRIGVSPSYITMLENGDKNNPSVEILLKISKVLGINFSQLSNVSDLFVNTDPQNTLDFIGMQIEENNHKNDIEYKQLYDSIETLFEKYDYTLDSDEQCNATDEELITISKDNQKILTVRKSILISSGENILKLINEFNEFAVQKLIKELKNN